MVRRVRDVVKILEQNGWSEIRIKGDHHIFYKEGVRRPIVIPGKMNDELKPGTASSILREAGLK